MDASEIVTISPSVSSSCLLLSLPPEIRNQIYALVLGGNELHVRVDPSTKNARIKNRKLQVFTCTAGLDEGSAATMIRSDDGHDFKNVSDWYHRHEQCGVNRYTNTLPPASSIFRGLALLETCTQIHSEAALLPFQTNTFIFDTKSAFHTFCKRLVPLQLKAITAISIEAGDFYHFEEKLTTVRHMTAPTRVTIFHPMPRPFNSFRDRRIRKRDFHNLKAWITLFKSLKLSSVKICFYPEIPDARRHRDGRHSTRGPTFAVAGHMRASITRYHNVCEEIENSLLENGRGGRADADGVKT